MIVEICWVAALFACQVKDSNVGLRLEEHFGCMR